MADLKVVVNCCVITLPDAMTEVADMFELAVEILGEETFTARASDSAFTWTVVLEFPPAPLAGKVRWVPGSVCGWSDTCAGACCDWIASWLSPSKMPFAPAAS